MKKGIFEYTIVSAYDRELLTCEISYQNQIVAEISQDTGIFLLEIYPPQSGWWEFPLTDFEESLVIAKEFLVGDKPI